MGFHYSDRVKVIVCYSFFVDSQEVDIGFWIEQEVTFVDTPVVNMITKIIESEHSF